MIVIAQMLAKWLEEGTLDSDRATKATKKRHKHIHGNGFKSIRHCNLTPAQYRNLHAKMVNGRLVKITKKRKGAK